MSQASSTTASQCSSVSGPVQLAVTTVRSHGMFTSDSEFDEPISDTVDVFLSGSQNVDSLIGM